MKNSRNTINALIEASKRLVRSSFAIFMLFQLLTTFSIFNQNDWELPDIRPFSVLLIILFLTFGIVWSVSSKKFIYPWQLTKRRLFAIYLSSIVFTIYFFSLFELDPNNKLFVTGLLTGLFMIFSPSTVEALETDNQYHLKNTWLVNIPVIIMICIFLLNFWIWKLVKDREEFMEANPLISSVEPKLVSNGNMITLRGQGFGPLQGDQSQVVGDNGVFLQVLDWRPSKVIAMIRSASDPGNLRIKKPATYRGVTQVRESNAVFIEFYDPATASAQLRTRYFDQLKDMSVEAKKLYGL